VLVVAGIVVGFAIVCAVVGVPVAALVRRTAEGWTALIADALLYGLIVVTLGVTLYSWLGWTGAATSIVVVLALAVCAIRARRWPVRGSLWMPGHRALTLAWVVVVVVAIVIRLETVNFLPWVGDMGAYVNWANEWVRTGSYEASWPPLFGAFLAIFSLAFGFAHTTSAVAITGILAIVAVARLMQRLGVNAWVTLALSALLALHPHAVWYSTFPSSESLNLPIFVTWAIALHAALTADRRVLRWAIATFAVATLALTLLRGSGALLLIPLAVVAVLAIASVDWRRLSGRVMFTLAAGTGAAAIGYWYGVTVIPRYFVTMQIRGILPDSICDVIDGLGLFDPTPQLIAILVGLPVALGFAAVALDRRFALAAETTSRWGRVLPSTIAMVFIVGVVALAAVGAMSFSILLRIGPWLIVGALAVFAVPVYRRLTAAQQIVAVVLVGVVLMFLALHTVRLGFDRGHSFYLYWDRYFVSEYLPAVIVLSGLAVTAIVPWLVRRRLAVVAGIVAAGLAIVPAAPALALQSQNTYMSGAFEFTEQLIALQDNSSDPILWSGSTENSAEGFFFQNTWMAFGVPMKRSFGLEVLNTNQRRNNFAPDEVLTLAALEAYALCSPTRSLTVYETQSGGAPLDERLAGSDAEFTRLGEVTSDISLLAQPASAGWTHARIAVIAWTVQLPTSLTGECVPGKY